jgi:hypothetical protein
MFGRNLQDLTIELNSRALQLNFFSVAVKVELRHHRQTSIAREIRALSEPTRVDEKLLDY